MNNSDKIILDLCGGTGAWSAPYKEAGYDVRLITLPEYDVRYYKPPKSVYGILAAPPCTVFSYARQRYGMPYPHEILEALSVVDACLRVIVVSRPQFWALENPRNKLRQWLGKPNMTFKQWWYGNAPEKPTCLWGNFNIPLSQPGHRTNPSTYKTKRKNADPKDAITPPGFARAFYEANR